ncbi:MAG: TonB-dependent receptor [Lentimicrobiaceae bacterium]|jgi:iron complex outermembrane receptor protein
MKKEIYLIIISFLMVTSGLKSQDLADTINLEAIEITGQQIKRTPFISIQVSKEIMLSVSTRDVGDYLRSIPNVSGIRKGGGAIDPVIRGFKFSQLNIVLDGGMKIENGCPNRMDPVSSRVEIEELSKISVVKGPYLLNYGPALGGVINLQTEDPHPYPKFEIHGNAMFGYETNWDGAKEYFSLYGGNSKIYFRASGGYRKYGDYKSGESDGESTTYSTSFRKYNYGAKVGYAISQKQNILLSYNESHGRDVMFPALTMDEKSDDTRMMSMDYLAKNLSKSIRTLDVKVYRAIVHHVMDNSNRETWNTKQMVADVDAINTGGKAVMGMKIKDQNLLAGLDFENIYKDGVRTMTMEMMGGTSTKNFNLWNKAVIQNAGLFAGYNTTFSSFAVDAAIRMDMNKADSQDTLVLIKDGVEYFNKTASQFVNLSANLGVTYYFDASFSVSLAVARGTRSPNMLERYIKLLAVGYDSYDYLGNPQLKPETNNEVDLTFKFSDQKLGSIYVNGFYSYVKDYISAKLLPSSVITPGTLGAPGVKQFVNVDNARFTGFEVGYTSPLAYKLGMSIVAALTYGRIPEVTKYIITAGQVTGDTLIKNDALPEIPPFETTISINYRLLKGKLIPKLSYRLVAAQQHVSQAFYEPETPGFSVLNFSFSYNVSKNININAGVNNIFDVSYYEHLNRRIVGSAEKLYEPGRVFFINLYLSI